MRSLSYSSLRQAARDSLRGKWGIAVGVTILYLILVNGVPTIIDLFLKPSDPQNELDGVSLLNTLIQLLWWIFVYAPLIIGYVVFIMKLVRRQEAETGDLFSRFKGEWYLRSIGVVVLQSIYIALWSILLIIPGIIKSYSYSMAYYILLDHPEYSAFQAITESRKLMNGHKWQLFVLHLTFIGWFLLSFISLGIGFFWLIPYFNAAQMQFYLKISGQSTEASIR